MVNYRNVVGQYLGLVDVMSRQQYASSLLLDLVENAPYSTAGDRVKSQCGSSRKISSASVATAIATRTRCFSPPDNESAGWLRYSVSSNRSIVFSDLSCAWFRDMPRARSVK